MTQQSDELMNQLRAKLSQQPTLGEQLPDPEGAMVREALAGQSVYEIAQNHSMSEDAVWRALGNAARLAAGEAPTNSVESGGLGSDTDPGVTGGYGETAFGSIGNEPPNPLPEEPPQQ